VLLLEISSLRPPNQKRSDLFNPFQIPSATELPGVTAQGLFGRERLVSSLLRCSFVADFNVSREND
jgi:hypothetical protein